MRTLLSVCFTLASLAWLATTVALSADVPKPKPDGETTASPITEVSGKTLKEWLKDMREPDPSDRERAIRNVVVFGQAAIDGGAVPYLIDRLTDGDSSVRCNAVIALGVLGSSAKDLPKVIEGLGGRVSDDRESIIRFCAAVALGRYGPEAKPVLPKLVAASKDRTSWEIRKAALFAIGACVAPRDAKVIASPPPTTAFQALIDAINDSSFEVRVEACSAMCGLGKPASEKDRVTIISVLQKRLQVERDMEVIIWLHMAMMAVDDFRESNMVALGKLLRHQSPSVRAQAANALGSLGERAKPRLTDLVEALQDKEPEVIFAAINALASTGSKSDAILDGIAALKLRKEVPQQLKDYSEKLSNKIKGIPEKKP